MNWPELKALLARLEAAEALGRKCACYKCVLEATPLHPDMAKIISMLKLQKEKRSKQPKPKRQTEADLHEEHGQ
jgi:hypothetical protein